MNFSTCLYDQQKDKVIKIFMSEAAPTKKAFEEEQLLKAIQTLIDFNVQEQTRLPGMHFGM